LDLLRDDLITVATKEIYAEGRPRRDIQKDIKSKERAIETLALRYVKPGLSQEDVRQCLYSIGDNHAFLRVNRDPCERMIAYLKEYFQPTQPKDNKRSLAIRSGRNGARLSHDHGKQYAYVLQSLSLWKEILHGAAQLIWKLTPTANHLIFQTCFIYGHLLSKISSPKIFHTAYGTPGKA
jgi:Protein of unknown function (DUF2009)